MGTRSKLKKKSARSPSSTKHGRIEILLEEIKAQNRATIEAVEMMGFEIRRDLGAEIAGLRMRIEVLELAVQKNSEDIRKNSEDIRKNSEDIQALKISVDRIDARTSNTRDVDALAKRVTVIENRLGITPEPR